MKVLPEKDCVSCGRRIVWRAKWRDCWDEVRYCSKRCRGEKPREVDEEVERVILDLLAKRKRGGTICPSEAARVQFGEDSWRGEMERVRRAARRLVSVGKLEMTQGGTVVDPSMAKGAIRLRLRGGGQ